MFKNMIFWKIQTFVDNEKLYEWCRENPRLKGFLQIWTRPSGKGGNQSKPQYPSLPWNKQTKGDIEFGHCCHLLIPPFQKFSKYLQIFWVLKNWYSTTKVMPIYLAKSKARIIADDYTVLPLQLRISYDLSIHR